MNLESIKKYSGLSAFNADGHWYTSYPSLNHWTEDFTELEYRQKLKAFTHTNKPTHLYIHIPFCKKLCYYCLCNIIISSDREKIQHFLDHLITEIRMLGEFKPNIREIHFGGGTPSHLDRKQFGQLCDALETICDLKNLDEVAMEVDPRTVNGEDLHYYADRGVTRISFGIQDFDPEVQKAINREQPPSMIEGLLRERHRFKGVNFDLLYGLPKQTQATLKETVRLTKWLAPDRITLLKYCHAPEVRRHMKLIEENDLPDPDELPIMFIDTTQNLTESGYEWIGLDHFATKTDSLASGKLYRTFNGFTPGRTQDMIGVGPTSTGAFTDTYSQSIYDLPGYYKAIEEGKFPVLRGYRMSRDDLMRREVIFSLLCNQEVDLGRYGDYFEKEWKKLYALPELVLVRNKNVKVTKWGRVLLRNICKIFDVKDVEAKHLKIAQLSMTRRIHAVPENTAHQPA